MRAITRAALVRRLLTLEAVGSQDQEALVAAAERVLDRLRAHLSQRIGQEGFRTLLSRALALTTAQFPHLRTVRVAEDGSLVGLRRAAVATQETRDDVSQQDTVEGVVALVAHLLGLLFTFIGEDLTLRILSTVVPALALPELASGDATWWENERP